MDYAPVTGERYAFTDAPEGTPTLTVTDAAGYAAALESLKTTGGTILVDSSGGPFRIDTHAIEAENRIVVTSADPADPAEILGMEVSRSSNITFTDLDFPAIEESGKAPREAALFQSSSNIEFIGNTIQGSADGKLGISTMDSTGFHGIAMRGCTDMTIADNAVADTLNGISVVSSTNTLLQGNVLTGMQADVFRVVSAVDTVVNRNVVDGLNGSSGDFNHPDILQYFDNSPDAPVERLTITNNYFNTGDTSYQGIYGGTNHAASAVPYTDIHIENNLIVTGSKNGIKIGWFDGVTITNNTLLYNADATSHKTMDTTDPVSNIPQISAHNAANVEVTGNLANVLIRDPANDKLSGSVVFENNFEPDYSDALAENHIDRIVVNAGSGGEKDLRDFQIIEGSAAEGYGSSLISQLADFDPLCMGWYSVGGVPRGVLLAVYGAVDGMHYTWTTTDGRVFEGAQVLVGFAEPGTHEITLTAETADGIVESISRKVVAEDPVLHDFLPGAGFDSVAGRHALTGDPVLEGSDDGSGRMVLDLDPGDAFTVARGMAELRDLSSFSILLDFRQQAPGAGGHIQAAGNIMYKHAGFSVRVDEAGALHVSILDSSGVLHETSSEAGVLFDTDWHSLSLSYDGAAGAESGLSVRLDDAEVARVAMSGTVDLSDRPINVGAFFGKPGIDGEIGGLRVVAVATQTDDRIRDPASMIPVAAMTGIVDIPPPEVTLPGDAEDGADDGMAGVALADDAALAGTLLDHVDFDAIDPVDGTIGGFAVVAGRNGAAIDLDGAARQSFSLGDLSGLEGQESFTVATTLRVDDPDVGGRILFLRGLFEMSVGRDGALDLRTTLHDDDGARNVARDTLDTDISARLVDGDFHRVVSSHSGPDGMLSVWIDGDLVAQSEIQGRVGTLAQTVIGNPWGGSFDGAVEEVSVLAAPVDAAAVAADHAAFAGLALTADDGGMQAPDHLSLADSALGGSRIMSEDFEDVLAPDVDADDGLRFVETADGSIALDLDGGGGQFFRLEGLDPLEGSDAFTIATSMRIDDSAEAGSILKIRGLFEMFLNGDGQLDWSTTLSGEDGGTSKARNVLDGEITERLSDGQMHRVVASYGAEAAEVSLWVDGTLVDNAPISGRVDDIRQALLGNPWWEAFDGAVDGIEIFGQAAGAELIESDYMAFAGRHHDRPSR